MARKTAQDCHRALELPRAHIAQRQVEFERKRFGDLPARCQEMRDSLFEARLPRKGDAALQLRFRVLRGGYRAEQENDGEQPSSMVM